jgi:hypothetical protein
MANEIARSLRKQMTPLRSPPPGRPRPKAGVDHPPPSGEG